MQVLLKSSKQKAFETVRINSTILLLLKKKVALRLQQKKNPLISAPLFQGFPLTALISQAVLVKC